MGLGDLFRRVLGGARLPDEAGAREAGETASPGDDTFSFTGEPPGAVLKRGDELVKVGRPMRAADCYVQAALDYAAEGFFLKAVATSKQARKFDAGRVATLELLRWLFATLGLDAEAQDSASQLESARGGLAALRPVPEREVQRRAVCATPTDLAARMVFADWLLERGDPRGDFIRLSSESRPNRKLMERSGALLDQHEGAWLEELRPLLLRWRFHHGFVESALVTTNTWLGFRRELFDGAPLVGVHLLHLGAPEQPELDEVVRGDHVDRIERLEFIQGTDTGGLSQRLVRLAPRLQVLRELVVRRAQVDGPAALELARVFPNLALLDLRGNDLPAALEAPRFVRR